MVFSGFPVIFHNFKKAAPAELRSVRRWPRRLPRERVLVGALNLITLQGGNTNQMQTRILRPLTCLLLAAAIPVFAADKSDKKTKAPEADVPAWEQAQPAVEAIDYGMYARIREEGLQHSHIMEYGSALSDAIGPRLTGSPNLAKANAWTRDQLTAMGCVNAHLDDWGEFGMGWQQLNTWVRMTSPDTAVFIAQDR